MSRVDEVLSLLESCSLEERERVFAHLRQQFSIHALEGLLHTTAEAILTAIQRAGGLTLRMIRGVIAESVFEVEVVRNLVGWRDMTQPGDLAYDYLLVDERGPVRVQVKLQRSKAGQPLVKCDMFVVETQKTRGGKKRATGKKTRPYRYAEFDILAVSMYPSAHRWDHFMYTVGDWLAPEPTDRTHICKFQYIPRAPNEHWTESFETAVAWFRQGSDTTIAGVPTSIKRRKKRKGRRRDA